MKNAHIIIAIRFVTGFFYVGCNPKNNTSSDQSENHLTTAQYHDSVYLKKGKEYAMQAKANLGRNLIKALGEKGSDGAVSFCKTRAIPITDSVSNSLSATIKRVSDHPRNPNNRANETQLKIIQQWKTAKDNKQKPTAQLLEIDGKMVGFYPITTNPMCMQCHGEPGVDIESLILDLINDLYPEDDATGYHSDQIRGAFVVEMDKL